MTLCWQAYTHSSPLPPAPLPLLPLLPMYTPILNTQGRQCDISTLFERLVRSTTKSSRCTARTTPAHDCVKVNLEAKLDEESEPEPLPTATQIQSSLHSETKSSMCSEMKSSMCLAPVVNFYEIEEELVEIVWDSMDTTDRARCTQPLATSHQQVRIREYSDASNTLSFIHCSGTSSQLTTIDNIIGLISCFKQSIFSVAYSKRSWRGGGPQGSSACRSPDSSAQL